MCECAIEIREKRKRGNCASVGWAFFLSLLVLSRSASRLCVCVAYRVTRKRGSCNKVDCPDCSNVVKCPGLPLLPPPHSSQTRTYTPTHTPTHPCAHTPIHTHHPQFCWQCLRSWTTSCGFFRCGLEPAEDGQGQGQGGSGENGADRESITPSQVQAKVRRCGVGCVLKLRKGHQRFAV